MKKKIGFVFLLVLSLFFFVSCNINTSKNTASSSIVSSSISVPSSSVVPSSSSTPEASSSVVSSSIQLHEEAWRQGQTIIGNPIEVLLTDTDLERLDTLMPAGLENVKNETDYDLFCDQYEEIKEILYKVVEAQNKYDMDFYMYGDQESMEKKIELTDKRLDILNWVNEANHTAYTNSFKDEFYEGMTDEEILELIGEDHDDEYYELCKELNTIQTQADNLDYNDPDFDDQFNDIYTRLVTSGTRLALKEGYSSYVDFAFDDNYSRDFKMEDTESFFANVIKYVLPKLTETKREYERVCDLLTSEEKTILNSFLYGDIFTGDFEAIEEYVTAVGGIMKEEFDKLFTDGGNYFISYDPNGYDLAFQNSFYSYTLNKDYIYVFYGPGYHDAKTVVHEFGHYLAATQNTGTDLCYDLAETHSQANEFLFFQYLCSHRDYSDNLKQAILLGHYYDAYDTIVTASLVNEIEKIALKSTYRSGDMLVKY